MPNSGLTPAKSIGSRQAGKVKKVMGLGLLLLMTLAVSGCGKETDRRESGSLGAAEGTIADCEVPLDPNPQRDDPELSVSVGSIDALQPSEPQPYSGMIGYVVKKEGSHILVVSPESRKLGPDMDNMDDYDATWFGRAPELIQVGMKVEAWAIGGQVEESYPGQAGAERVDVLNDEPPQEADLSEAEAVRDAIGQLEPDEHSFAIVRDAEYRPGEDSWRIELLNEDRQSVQIEIED
ncbi:DUF3221 domain-containing protein [Saccharibacillus qingshengii]|uniref:DUF3221 domain-containing protein n=1 Tax=Saccharibacillus qingshengii TaxID=1763540 RepID=UPI001551898D|nr:DUF3221 domain-containing protein [Saccharibacillus qingshengii]